MDKKELEDFAIKFAKGIKTEKALNFEERATGYL